MLLQKKIHYQKQRKSWNNNNDNKFLFLHVIQFS